MRINLLLIYALVRGVVGSRNISLNDLCDDPVDVTGPSYSCIVSSIRLFNCSDGVSPSPSQNSSQSWQFRIIKKSK